MSRQVLICSTDILTLPTDSICFVRTTPQQGKTRYQSSMFCNLQATVMTSITSSVSSLKADLRVCCSTFQRYDGAGSISCLAPKSVSHVAARCHVRLSSTIGVRSHMQRDNQGNSRSHKASFGSTEVTSRVTTRNAVRTARTAHVHREPIWSFSRLAVTTHQSFSVVIRRNKARHRRRQSGL